MKKRVKHMKHMKHAKRSQRMKRRRFFVVGTGLTCVLLMLFGMYTLVGAMIFGSSGPSLQELAEPYFTAATPYQHIGTPKTEYQENNPYWFAMQYPQTGQVAVDTQIVNLKTQIAEDFVKQYESMAAQQAQKQNKAKTAFTLFLRYESYQTDNILSIVFQDAYYSNDSPSVFSHWHPYLLDAKTGELLGAEAVFRGDTYRKKASAYALDYIEAQQAYQGVLYPYYQTTLRPESEVFDHFALTEDSVIFYINKYEILPAEYDAIRIEIPRTEFDGCYLTDPVTQSVISVTPQVTVPVTPQEGTQEDGQTIQTIQTNGRTIDPTKPMVALTFDDGPSPTATQKILDILEQYQAVATFYDVGYRVEQYPDVVKREAALGCEVGSHSYDHKDFSKLSAAQIRQDVERTYAAFATSGVTPTTFRPPYGSSNDTVKQNVPMPIVTWSVDTLDWKSRNADSICRVVAQEGNLDGKVILMHGIYDSTAEAVARLVPQLVEQGYQLVTVSELIQYRHQEEPQNGKLYGFGYFQP